MDRNFTNGILRLPLVWLGIFAAAMGLLEAIVVVYLRELYFPNGFSFPLRFLPQRMIRMEMLRELSTIVMLVSVAAAAARKPLPRFSAFLFIFGVWDIFYYLFLKILLGWPESFLTWDVLFLIPLTWTAPVLAPLICSFSMIGLAALFLTLDRKYGSFGPERTSWLLLIAGAAVIFLSFIWDDAAMLLHGGYLQHPAALAESREFHEAVAAHMPTDYRWDVFLIGEALIFCSGVLGYRNAKKHHLYR